LPKYSPKGIPCLSNVGVATKEPKKKYLAAKVEAKIS
jgi:hypothetical protein